MYRVKNPKLLNKSLDELCHAKDQVRISDNCYPVGDVFGVDIYEVTHVNTNQNVYITINEIYK